MTTPATTRPPPGTTLIVNSGTPKAPYTANQETDVRTALCRGLMEYISTLTLGGDSLQGENLMFQSVFATWPESEDQATYPAALVYSRTPGVYDSSRFSPTLDRNQQIPAPDERFLLDLAEFNLEITLEVWAQRPAERSAICAKLEQALSPVDWMYGFILQLPHYFNSRGVYELKSMQYEDTEVDAMQRHRKAAFTLSAQGTLLRLISPPPARIVTKLEVGPSVDVGS